MASSNSIFKNFMALGSGEALSRLIAFGVTVYLARVLGVDGYGVLAFALGVNLYLTKIADFAIEWVGTKEVAKAPDAIAELASSLLGARLILTLLLIAVSIPLAMSILPEPERMVLILYFLVLIPLSLNTKWVHMGLNDARPVGITRVVGETVALVIVLSLVRGKGQLWVPPIAQAVGETVVTLILWSLLRRGSYRFWLGWNPAIVKPIFLRALPLLGHILLGLFIYNSDLIFLRLFHDSEAVGIYSVAYTLISFLANIGLAYGMSLLPAFSRLNVKGDGEMALYHTSLAHIYAVSLPVAIGGFLLADHIIDFAFGRAYEGSVIVLQIIIWSIPFNIFRNVPWSALIVRNRQDLLFKAILYAAIVNIALNLLLIPKFSVVGASIATIITEAVAGALMLAFAASQGLTFAPARRFVRATIAGIAMAGAIAIVNPVSMVTAILLGAVCYLSVLTVSGGIKFYRSKMPVLNV